MCGGGGGGGMTSSFDQAMGFGARALGGAADTVSHWGDVFLDKGVKPIGEQMEYSTKQGAKQLEYSSKQLGNQLTYSGKQAGDAVSDTLGHWGQVGERFWYDFQNEMAKLMGQKPPDKSRLSSGSGTPPPRTQQGSFADAYGRNLADSPMGTSKAVGADLLDSKLPTSGTLL